MVEYKFNFSYARSSINSVLFSEFNFKKFIFSDNLLMIK